ncbi:MAG TPA: hypothetical protein VHQ24_15350 [Lachnospiraceae bacterium]|nr:hypothetical protein [Lachnospiraceae bacterium]
MLVEAERLMITDFIPVIMQHLNINIIYGIVLEENKTSHKVLEKCDFRLDYIGIGK